MKIDCPEHPKTLDLMSRLNLDLPATLGTLELLWRFTSRYSPRGDIGRHSDGTIAKACCWALDPKFFVSHLVLAGFLDEHKAARLIIHDWSEHMPSWCKAKLLRDKVEVFTSKTKTKTKTMDKSFKNTTPDATTSVGFPSVEKRSVGKGLEGSSEPLAADSKPPILTFATAGPAPTWELRQEHIDKLAGGFPALDVLAQCRKALAWTEANPGKRKTARGMMSFLFRWMDRAQNDKGGSNGKPAGHRQGPGQSYDPTAKLDFSE